MNEQDIPIEIAAGKLLEWLESRKIVPKNWQTQIRDIRNKISNALKDMPSHDDLVKLLSGAYINYFHCVQIVEILKTTEADTKTLFGRYGSQRMNDWQQIVKAYEKDNLYLAEAAQILQRYNTEVPGLRKQRNKIGQLVDDAKQRNKDLLKSEEVLHAEKNAMCDKLQIKGVDFRAEFISRIKMLPNLYENIAAQCQKSLRKPIEFYLDFSGNSNLLPVLRHVIEKGNTTVYEYIYNETPLSVVEPEIALKLTVGNSITSGAGGGGDAGDNQEIDFGNFDDAANNEINFDVIDADLGTGDIDWGEIEVVPSPGDDSSLEESGIVVAGSGAGAGEARGEEALTILDNNVHRDLFFDELCELEAFLQMRQYDFKSEAASSFIFYLIDGNSKYELESVTKMVNDVQQLIDLSSSSTIDHLYRLKHSPTYADTIASKLHNQVNTVEKLKATRVVVQEKIQKLNEDKINIQPEIRKLIENSKTLLSQIEREISKRYKGRVVTIYGGIEFEQNEK